jgi:hypothetical protein
MKFIFHLFGPVFLKGTGSNNVIATSPRHVHASNPPESSSIKTTQSGTTMHSAASTQSGFIRRKKHYPYDIDFVALAARMPKPPSVTPRAAAIWTSPPQASRTAFSLYTTPADPPLILPLNMSKPAILLQFPKWANVLPGAGSVSICQMMLHNDWVETAIEKPERTNFLDPSFQIAADGIKIAHLANYKTYSETGENISKVFCGKLFLFYCIVFCSGTNA